MINSPFNCVKMDILFNVKVVKDILNKYFETWSSSKAQEQFLEYDLCIPIRVAS